MARCVRLTKERMGGPHGAFTPRGPCAGPSVTLITPLERVGALVLRDEGNDAVRSIVRFARSVAAVTGFLLVQTLESVYARCQLQTLRAVDPDGSHSHARV